MLQNKSVKFDDDESDVPVITTQDLYSKMKEFDLL